MEENNIENQKIIEKRDCFLCEHPLLKAVLCGLLIFLGAYCAFYTVSDWHFKRMLDPMYQMHKFDRDFSRHERKFEKMQKNNFELQEKVMRPQGQEFIHAEKLNDAYRFTIDLKPFNNNDKNVEVRTEGNMLIIDAAGEKNNRNKQEITKYSQAFAFGEDIKANEITKVREGNNYIITVPVD